MRPPLGEDDAATGGRAGGCGDVEGVVVVLKTCKLLFLFSLSPLDLRD